MGRNVGDGNAIENWCVCCTLSGCWSVQSREDEGGGGEARKKRKMEQDACQRSVHV